MWLIICLGCVLWLSSRADNFKSTTIYIVRHAEKDTGRVDPPLNAQGLIRARALTAKLKTEKFAGIFSSPYKRTRQTAMPLAQYCGLPVLDYDPDRPDQLVQTINTEYNGRTTLIVGHSNTILPLMEAFGVKPPVSKLNDDDYDLLFKISISKTGEKQLKVMRYGQPHHSTELPTDE